MGTFQVETVADTPSGGTFTSSADLQLNSGGTLGGSGTLELNDPFLVTGGTINDSVTVNVNSGGIIGAWTEAFGQPVCVDESVRSPDACVWRSPPETGA